MCNPYDLRTWSRVCREEALHEAQRRRLKVRPPEGRETRRGLGRPVLALANALAVLGAAAKGRAW